VGPGRVSTLVKDGEFLICVGPSGCGKSTLLRIIAGLENATSGDISIDDRRVNNDSPTERGIAMVFQTYALYPHLTVRDNMSLGLKQSKLPKAEITERVDTATQMLALQDYLDRRPAELSGGQRQRVAIGRAVVREPSLFLFDEPLSNLDAALRVNTEQMGTPMELYNEPVNQFVAGFIGSPQMNFIDTSRIDGTTLGQIARGAKTLGIRPEHIELVDSDSGDLTGTVSHVERLGGDTNIYVDCADIGLITVRLFGQADIAIDSNQSLAFDQQKLFRFDSAGRTMPSS